MNERLPNGEIDENYGGYTTKTERYTTFISDMRELYAIA